MSEGMFCPKCCGPIGPCTGEPGGCTDDTVDVTPGSTMKRLRARVAELDDAIEGVTTSYLDATDALAEARRAPEQIAAFVGRFADEIEDGTRKFYGCEIAAARDIAKAINRGEWKPC